MNMKKNIITILILVFSVCMIGNIKCYAASGSFSLSKSSVSIKKGKSSTVKLTVKNCEGTFSVKSSDTSVATVSITDNDSDGDGWITSTASIKIKAKKKGTATITVVAADVADTNANEVTGSKTIKVTVTDTSSSNNSSDSSNSSNNSTEIKVQKDTTESKKTSDNISTEPKVSTDATLKNLGITPDKYDFSGFRKMTTSYDVTVPYEAKEIKIYAETNNSKSTITGIGSKKLDIGVNTFNVKVTAEDKKTTKTYTLKITREEEKNEEEPTENEPVETTNENQIIGLTNLEVDRLSLTPTFSNDIYQYEITTDEDINELDIKTQTSSDDITVEIIGNQNLQKGENVITLLVYNSKKDETTTYQIIAKLHDKIDLTDVNNSISSVQMGLLAKKCIIIGALIIIIILTISFIIKRNKILSENEFSENNDKLNLSEDVDMFGRINENTEIKKKCHKKTKGKRFK